MELREQVLYEDDINFIHLNFRLTVEERYKNDERILKVWIKLAENSLGNDCNIFDHANSIGSLNRYSIITSIHCLPFFIIDWLYSMWNGHWHVRVDLNGLKHDVV